MEVESGIVKLTPSLVAMLRHCGFQEAWLRKRRADRRPFVETAASARGKSIHAALAEFHAAGGAETHTVSDLHRLLGRCWVREGYPDAEEERVARLQSEEELARYYDVFGRDGGTLTVERSWSLRRDLDGVRTEWFGRLDWVRVDPSPDPSPEGRGATGGVLSLPQPARRRLEPDPSPEGRGATDGVLEIVDWKTHGRISDPETLAADPVTVMYARLGRALAQHAFAWPGGGVRFSLLYVGRLEKVTVTLTREMVECGEAELGDLARGLQDGRLEPREGPWCFWSGGCPVREAGECPLFPEPRTEGDW